VHEESESEVESEVESDLELGSLFRRRRLLVSTLAIRSVENAPRKRHGESARGSWKLEVEAGSWKWKLEAEAGSWKRKLEVF
jgi:hypothetical protein